MQRTTNNYVCTGCGRSFARKFTAQRHINRVEGGKSSLVTKDLYEIGVRTGMIIPKLVKPQYKKNNLRFDDLVRQKMKEKAADFLAEKAFEVPEYKSIFLSMFLNEDIRDQNKSDKDDAFSKLMSRMMNQFLKP